MSKNKSSLYLNANQWRGCAKPPGATRGGYEACASRWLWLLGGFSGERDAAEKDGWVFESVAGYLFPPPNAFISSATSKAQPPSATSGSPTPQTHKIQAGAIAGGIVGSVVLIAIGVGFWVLSRCRARSVSSLAPVSFFDSTAPVSPVMRHGGSKRHPQSPFNVSSPTPLGAETVSSTNLQTSELVGLVHQLNDQLQGQRWDEEEAPPDYTSDR
ncbi:hypothetical protein B0H19DRAFT_1065428 [Mycena capillaripes]|nr:hypothetical protein B0H19DRAFT_1065428 [Mycena capillaripes]